MNSMTTNKLATFPLEQMGFGDANDSTTIFGAWNWTLTVGDVRAARLRRALDPKLQAALQEALKSRSTAALLPNGSAVFINYGDQPEDTAHLCCTACGGSGHIDDQRAVAGEQPLEDGDACRDHDPASCIYPACNCPFDAPADPTWCARGLDRNPSPEKRYGYSITPRDEGLGGGWQVRLLDNGQEIGGGAFPIDDESDADQAYAEAESEAEAWLQSRDSSCHTANG